MKEQCFEIGTIQAFLDGELSAERLESVARHVALCDDCALLLQEAEEESAFAFDILGEEFNTLVPTERIRANVYQAIAEIDKPKVSFWQKVFGYKILSNPSVVAFASLLIVVGVFATVLSLRDDSVPQIDVAVKETPKIETKDSTERVDATPVIPAVSPTFEANKPKSPEPRVEKVVYKPESKAPVQKVVVKNRKPITEGQNLKTGTPAILDGEDVYLKTIANLETNVNAKKDNVLRASSRVSYERNMAVIDDSIKRMKEEVRKNPKNEAAKQILRNSYQNKIELLNSVTERGELFARLD